MPKGELDPDEFELEIIDAGAEDIEEESDVFIITTALEDFGSVQKKLEELGVEPENSELQRIPNDTKEIDTPTALQLLRMIEDFEDDDDVQNVYHNLEMNRDLMDILENE